MGIRLTTMVQQLATHFEFPPVSRGAGFYGRMRCLSASLSGGWEVLVFFDFMCLPQIGLAKTNGNVEIPRTELEQRMFFECLPHMGLLYSQFPVMVLSEVTPDVHPYEDSGWCFSELSIARFGDRLTRFSPAYAREETHVRDSVLHSDLSTKRFFDENDRRVVAALLADFSLKDLLFTAVKNKESSMVNDLLAPMPNYRKYALLDQPIDDSLDTLLHRAVAGRSLELVLILLKHGAHPRLLNLRGDTAGQWFMFPRCSAAARHCLALREPSREHVSEGDARVSGKDACVTEKADAPKAEVCVIEKADAPRAEEDDLCSISSTVLV